VVEVVEVVVVASVLVVLEPIVAPCSAQLIAGTSDDTVAVDDVDDILSGTHAPPLLPLTSFTLFLLLLLLLLLMPLDLPDTWQVNTRHINSASNRIVRVHWSTCAEKSERNNSGRNICWRLSRQNACGPRARPYVPALHTLLP